jgi:hypothetical protein
MRQSRFAWHSQRARDVGEPTVEQIADHLANRRVRAFITWSRASHARSGYAA